MSSQIDLKQAALDYHEFPTPGKLSIVPTKQLVNQNDLAMAYSPGVAAACEAILADPANVFRYTGKGNNSRPRAICRPNMGAWYLPRAKTNAYCAPCRSWWMKNSLRPF